ncbi:MAG: Bax inhibitor-1/YccA family protein [Chloroflexi bacterium]|nr:Bax inhibitor-1/YccA family protein [Chloroflexota bacterium]
MGYSPTLSRDDTRERTLFQQVYAWMAAGLAITGFVAYWTYSSGFINSLSGPVMIGLIVAELVVVIGLSWGISRLSGPLAVGAFLFYSLLNGLTLSTIFLIYTSDSIASTFFVTAATFGAMSMYGYTTKRDLTTIGNMLFMALLGLIIASVVNLFLQSSALYWILTYAGILIFVGLIAYDTQRIKRLSETMGGQTAESIQKVAIMGALRLYLDFINLFLRLLQVLGKRR